ncbi:MAG: hypothetical protein Q7N50_02045 [Armatimonadota bacterium]|nr:hypothetical protein [Armatimonadota bacterium]
MGNRKTWAIILGTTAGVTLVSVAVTWYMKTHSAAGPIVKDVQGMISDAYEKIQNLEQALIKRRQSEEAA